MVEKEPTRDTAFGAFSAFDDKSEGTLGLGEINVCGNSDALRICVLVHQHDTHTQGIFCCLGEPLKPDEVAALMCEINYLAVNGKVRIDDLMEFFYGKVCTRVPHTHTQRCLTPPVPTGADSHQGQ